MAPFVPLPKVAHGLSRIDVPLDAAWQYNPATTMALFLGTRLGSYEVEVFCGREASLFEAGSPQPKSRLALGRGISP
jgi:hypothetical protein